MSANGEVGGSAGVFVSIFMLAGGIVSIAVRNSQKNGGNIAVVILFLLASFLGIGLAGSFSDLNVWAGWCLINAVLAIISIFKQNKEYNNEENNQDNFSFVCNTYIRRMWK